MNKIIAIRTRDMVEEDIEKCKTALFVKSIDNKYAQEWFMRLMRERRELENTLTMLNEALNK